MSPYIYGMFIEPIGNLVGRSLWAEMLDDRKFHAAGAPGERGRRAPAGCRRPPSGHRLPQVAPARRRRCGGDGPGRSFRRRAQPERRGRKRAAGGLAQGGIGIAAGRRYRGSLWLSGDPTAQVEVALVWGDGPVRARDDRLARARPRVAQGRIRLHRQGRQRSTPASRSPAPGPAASASPRPR